MTCPPCNNDCRQGRDCPRRRRLRQPAEWTWFEVLAFAAAAVITLWAVAAPDLRAWRDGLPPVTFAEEPRGE